MKAKHGLPLRLHVFPVIVLAIVDAIFPGVSRVEENIKLRFFVGCGVFSLDAILQGSLIPSYENETRFELVLRACFPINWVGATEARWDLGLDLNGVRGNQPTGGTARPGRLEEVFCIGFAFLVFEVWEGEIKYVVHIWEVAMGEVINDKVPYQFDT